MLKPFERHTRVTVWDDTNISPGVEWRSAIEHALDAARVVVLLVSPHYLASDFVAQHELPLLFKLAEHGVQVFWIPVSASSVTRTEIARYQALSDPSRPLDSLTPAARNRELVNIAQQIVGSLVRNDD
jgi:internalin A